MINNIIFDFDGILVDSEILAGRAFSRYLKTQNLHLSEQEFSRSYSGNKLVEVISKLSLRFKIKDQNIFFNEVVALSNSIYSRELRYISNPPEDLELIHLFPETDLQCGVISSTLDNIQMDYRYGLELGLDAIPALRKLATKVDIVRTENKTD